MTDPQSLPSKYKWEDLQKIYGTHLGEKLVDLPMDRSVFCYIPSEELLASSFGEYPFHAELAPRSIFSQKVHYMAYSLLAGGWSGTDSYRPLARFDTEKYRRKVERTVISQEHKNTRAILVFFTWTCVLSASLFVLLVTLVIIAGVISGDLENPDVDALGDVVLIGLSVILITAIFPMAWYFLRAVFGLMSFYRDRHWFERALLPIDKRPWVNRLASAGADQVVGPKDRNYRATLLCCRFYRRAVSDRGCARLRRNVLGAVKTRFLAFVKQARTYRPITPLRRSSAVCSAV